MSIGLIDELRRRGVLRAAALYVIAAWLVIQAADVFFPAWGIPETALRYLIVAAFLGFPITIVFGWMYDVTMAGIVRTPAACSVTGTLSAALRRGDYLTLAGLARTSSFAFKGNELGTVRISDILGVKFLLQGSVRKVGNDLRISA